MAARRRAVRSCRAARRSSIFRDGIVLGGSEGDVGRSRRRPPSAYGPRSPGRRRPRPRWRPCRGTSALGLERPNIGHRQHAPDRGRRGSPESGPATAITPGRLSRARHSPWSGFPCTTFRQASSFSFAISQAPVASFRADLASCQRTTRGSAASIFFAKLARRWCKAAALIASLTSTTTNLPFAPPARSMNRSSASSDTSPPQTRTPPECRPDRCAASARWRTPARPGAEEAVSEANAVGARK